MLKTTGTPSRGPLDSPKPPKRELTAEDAAAFAHEHGSRSVTTSSMLPADVESAPFEAKASDLPVEPDTAHVQQCKDNAESQGDAGRVWNRFFWCQRHRTDGIIYNVNSPGQELGHVWLTYTAIGYANKTDRNVRIFLRGEKVERQGTFELGGRWRMQVRCRGNVSGCSVDGPNQDDALNDWDDQRWISWTVKSDENALADAPDKMGRMHWYFEGQSMDGFGNVTVPGEGLDHKLRCDSATYFAQRPKACIFDDVLPFFQYSLSGDGVDEVAAHIKNAQQNPSQTYPHYGLPKTIPGRYTGSKNEPRLHRIRTTAAGPGESTDVNATYRSNVARKDNACQATGIYANAGLPTPPDTSTQQCDEYPMAATAEGAGKGDHNFSVRAVKKGENSRAGGLISGSYGYVWRDRILFDDRDMGYYINITNCGSCGGGGPSGPSAPPFHIDPAIKGRLGGTFIQPDLIDRWSDAELASEFTMMKNLGMTQVVLQWSANSHDKRERGDKTAVFPTGQAGYRKITSTDVVGRALQAADNAGINVWLGLQVNDDWWRVYAGDQSWLNAEAATSKQFANELTSRYGGHASFSGWYLPFEMDNVHFDSTAAQDRMIGFYRDVTDELRRISPTKPTLTAPFFNALNTALPGWQDAGAFGYMWQRILEQVGISVIALQDGVGAGHAYPSMLDEWYAAMSNAITMSRSNAVLISDTETFKIGASGLQPMPTKEFVESMQAVSGHVYAYWSFSFSHYQSPRSPFGSNAYLQAYSRWRQQDALRANGTDGDTPSTPQNLTATVLSPQDIQLSWNPSADGNSGVAGYHIYRNGELVADKIATSGGFLDRQLDGSTRYEYQVRAFDGSGNESGLSNTAAGTTAPMPSSPVNHARCGATTGGSGCAYTTEVTADPTYPDAGRSLTDGIHGVALYGSQWQGRNAAGVYSFTADLGTTRPITEINTSWLQVRQDYAFLPPNVKYLISNDGTNFSEVSSIDIPAVSAGLQTKTYRAINLKDGTQPKSGRFVKIVVDGGTAWTLLDEIEVRGPA